MTRERAVPWLLVGLYWFVLATLAGELKLDHLTYGGAVLLLTHLGPRGRQVLLFLLPFILTGVIYDSQRYWGPHVRGAPHIAEPYLLEKSLFGIPSDGGPLTLNEWFGLHLHPVLDFIAGGAYLTFIGIFMLVALLLTLRINRAGVAAGAEDVRDDWSPERRFWTAQTLVWCFLVVNIVGYATWYLYPAAPPLVHRGVRPRDGSSRRAGEPSANCTLRQPPGDELFRRHVRVRVEPLRGDPIAPHIVPHTLRLLRLQARSAPGPHGSIPRRHVLRGCLSEPPLRDRRGAGCALRVGGGGDDGGRRRVGDHFFFFSSFKRTERSMDMMEITMLPTTAGQIPRTAKLSTSPAVRSSMAPLITR